MEWLDAHRPRLPLFPVHHRRLAHLLVRLATARLAARHRLLRQIRSRLHLLPHILRRSAIIFAIGLLINAFPYYHLGTWRIAGVLQRIALCYLAASLLYLWTGTRTRWAIIAALLIGYWLLLRFVPVPGFGIPTVDIPLLDPDRNLVAWLDRHFMMGRLYEKTRDPEGLLSTFPAIANTLFGVAVGEWIRNLRADSAKLLRRLTVAGLTCFAAGELWGLIFPINKKLWTSSYALLTVGLAMLALAACYWLLDVKKLRGRWTVFPLVFGTNCIFAYAFSEFVATAAVIFKFHLDGHPVSYKDALNSFTFDNIPQPQLVSAWLCALLRRLLLVLHLAPLPPQNLSQGIEKPAPKRRPPEKEPPGAPPSTRCFCAAKVGSVLVICSYPKNSPRCCAGLPEKNSIPTFAAPFAAVPTTKLSIAVKPPFSSQRYIVACSAPSLLTNFT